MAPMPAAGHPQRNKRSHVLLRRSRSPRPARRPVRQATPAVHPRTASRARSGPRRRPDRMRSRRQRCRPTPGAIACRQPAGCGTPACRTAGMTCRERSTRENRRFSRLEKVLEDFFHGQPDEPSAGVGLSPCDDRAGMVNTGQTAATPPDSASPRTPGEKRGSATLETVPGDRPRLSRPEGGSLFAQGQGLFQRADRPGPGAPASGGPACQTVLRRRKKCSGTFSMETGQGGEGGSGWPDSRMKTSICWPTNSRGSPAVEDAVGSSS